MSDEEKKVLWEFLNSLNKNLNSLIEDKSHDAEDQLKKYAELMVAISKLTTTFNLLIDELRNTNRIIKKEHHNTQETVLDAAKHIQEAVEGKTKVIIKEVSKKTLRWFQFWERLPKLDFLEKKAVNKNGEIKI